MIILYDNTYNKLGNMKYFYYTMIILIIYYDNTYNKLRNTMIILRIYYDNTYNIKIVKTICQWLVGNLLVR
jgi:hypothetical protein